MLSEGYSSIENTCAIINADPLACTWLTKEQDRTPFVVLEANRNYWNTERGPRLERVIFDNCLSPEEALELCTTTEGKVDLVTEVSPENADRVKSSSFANLIAVDTSQVMAGVFNYYKKDIDFSDIHLREAFNAAIDRNKLIEKGFLGYAKQVPSLTPPWALDFPVGLKPKEYDPIYAKNAFQNTNWPNGRLLHIATTHKYSKIAELISQNLQDTLNLKVKIEIISGDQEFKWIRIMAEKKLVPTWDVFLTDVFAFFSIGTPAFIHREFFGLDGKFRVGPQFPQFDRLFAEMEEKTEDEDLIQVAKQIDKYVYRQSLALFLCAPQTLYAVNKHVIFRPYRTTFELADTEVDDRHWSIRKNKKY
jgi:peptide/nickel transport system substrate-binding protein